MDNQRTRSSTARRGQLTLLTCCGVIALVWLVVLPRLARTSTASERLRWLEEKKIDPAAMFYTDLECLDETLQQLERADR